jgi:hypothetical protein
MRMLRCLIVGLAVAAAGCQGNEGPALTASPSRLSAFGYVDLTLTGDLASLGEVSAVTVGGVPAYHLRAGGTSLTVTVQGAPKPGRADVIVTGARGRALSRGLVTYDPPASGAPLTWAAFGASLTQGTQSLGIDEHSQLFGVSAHIARAAGVYLALPLFQPGLAPPLTPDDFTLDCEQKPDTGLDVTRLTAALTDPATGLFDLRRGRLAWETTPRNLAIGGSKLLHQLRGGRGVVAVLEHVVEEPTIDPGDVVGNVAVSQIDRLETLDPDVGICTDLLANDLDPAVVDGEDIRLDLNTPLAAARPLLDELLARLGKLHGQYFLANMPLLTTVPNVLALRARRIAAGSDTAASFDAKIEAVDDQIAAYNAALLDGVKRYPNLHVVDFKGRVEEVTAGGIVVGGEPLVAAKMGGLYSLDQLHFTDTGYAIYANLFIDELNAVLKTAIPHVDEAAIHAADALAPARLRAHGFTCVPPPA